MRLKQLESTFAQRFPGHEFVNAHVIDINAGQETIWNALPDAFPHFWTGPLMAAGLALAALVRGDRLHAGRLRRLPLEVGATVDGLTVEEVTPGQEVVVRGSHRYSQFLANLYLEPLSESHTCMYQVTWANFPGPVARLYFLGVRLFHDLLVEYGLHRVKRFIERQVVRQSW